MTKKQLKTIQIIEYFIPTNCDFQSSIDDSQIGIQGIAVGDKSPEQVFFDKTDRGITPEQTSDIIRLRALLWGHRRMSLQKALWLEAKQKGYSLTSDFENEPDYIQAIFEKL